MKRLFVPPWSYLSVFIGIGLLVGILIGLPYWLARHTSQTHARLSATAAQQARAVSSSLVANGLMSRVALGQIGPPRAFANSLQEITDDFTPAPLSAPSYIQPPLTLPGFYPARYVRKVNQTASNHSAISRSAEEALADTKRLLVRQSGLNYALVNILSYNPAVDFAKFEAGSADTKKRLDLAAAGLNRTRQSLASYETSADPTLKDVIAEIDRLIVAQKNFASDGNVHNWIITVQTAQNHIVQNRDTYWTKTAGALQVRLAANAEQLSSAREEWDALAAGRL